MACGDWGREGAEKKSKRVTFEKWGSHVGHARSACQSHYTYSDELYMHGVFKCGAWGHGESKRSHEHVPLRGTWHNFLNPKSLVDPPN